MFATVLQALGTVAVVLVLSELGKRWSTLGAAAAALPLMTMLVVAKIAYDADKGGGIAQANEFATKFFYLFWPGLVFLIVLPLQRLGVSFWWSFAIAVFATFATTMLWVVLLKFLGVKVD